MVLIKILTLILKYMNKVEITGYLFELVSEAQNAVNDCNDYYKLPKDKTSSTQNWCMWQAGKIDKTDIFYIIADKSLIPVLGEPIKFTIDI